MQLKTLYPKLDGEQRERLAAKAGIKPPFLWQIATQWNGKRPSIKTIVRLAAADRRLTVQDLVTEFSTAKAKANTEAA